MLFQDLQIYVTLNRAKQNNLLLSAQIWSSFACFLSQQLTIKAFWVFVSERGISYLCWFQVYGSSAANIFLSRRQDGLLGSCYTEVEHTSKNVYSPSLAYVCKILSSESCYSPFDRIHHQEHGNCHLGSGKQTSPLNEHKWELQAIYTKSALIIHITCVLI